jgi:sterol desaturase/sphingolipid hydroxylase (fatty acid hydroxylase superfamily)
MMLHCTIGYINWSLPVGLYAAWLNPGAPGGFAWDYSLPNFVGLVYFSLAVLMAWDAWSFFHHRWLHLNKTAFTLVHAKHHEHQAALSVRTGGYMTATEGFLSDALPLLVMYALGAAIGNWWYPLAGMLQVLSRCYTPCFSAVAAVLHSPSSFAISAATIAVPVDVLLRSQPDCPGMSVSCQHASPPA